MKVVSHITIVFAYILILLVKFGYAQPECFGDNSVLECDETICPIDDDENSIPGSFFVINGNIDSGDPRQICFSIDESVVSLTPSGTIDVLFIAKRAAVPNTENFDFDVRPVDDDVNNRNLDDAENRSLIRGGPLLRRELQESRELPDSGNTRFAVYTLVPGSYVITLRIDQQTQQTGGNDINRKHDGRSSSAKSSKSNKRSKRGKGKGNKKKNGKGGKNRKSDKKGGKRGKGRTMLEQQESNKNQNKERGLEPSIVVPFRLDALVAGDIDGNFVVDQSDISLLESYLLESDPFYCPLADANRDGRVNNLDIETVESNLGAGIRATPRLATSSQVMASFEAAVPSSILDGIPNDFFEVVAHHSPTGFIPGEIIVTNSNPLSDETGFVEMFANENSVVTLQGYVETTLPSIPQDTTVNVYNEYTHSGNAPVRLSDGFFSMIILDVPPGRHLYYLTASSPNYNSTSSVLLDDTDNNSGSGQRQLFDPNDCRIVSDAPPSADDPAIIQFYSSYAGDCAPSLTFTLRWDGSTSDVDLHVYEPNGEHVYFFNRNGVYGFLDTDDTYGFGPENYIAQNVILGRDYVARVDMFRIGRDSNVEYTLECRAGGTLLWVETGTLDFTGDSSERYSVSFDRDPNTLCGLCGQSNEELRELEPAWSLGAEVVEDTTTEDKDNSDGIVHIRGQQGRPGSRNLIANWDGDTLPPTCESCEPDDEELTNFWCLLRASHSLSENINCDDSTQDNPKWEAWNVMVNMATDVSSQEEFRESAKILIAMLYNDSDDADVQAAEQLAQQVQTQDGDYRCGAYHMLDVMCSAQLVNKMTDTFRLLGKAFDARRDDGNVVAGSSFRDTVHDTTSELFDALETELLQDIMTPPDIDLVLAGMRSYDNVDLLFTFSSKLDLECGYDMIIF